MNKADIDIACMSLMWGSGLYDSEMQAWISDVKAAGPLPAALHYKLDKLGKVFPGLYGSDY